MSPDGVRVQQVWIKMPDGATLAGRLWLPRDPAPVVIEWIPYRQSDGTAIADSMMHGWFAANGIAALRIDIRGSGNSGGVLGDEYSRQEQDDAVAAIAWAAAQPWCTGAVGMIGISWGGFAALQVAARRPPALKAIISCCASDDRYRDDVHFMGGTLLNDGVAWGVGLLGLNARPPDPAHVGEAWRSMWLERLEALRPPLATWLSHMERDAYWAHGSVCEDPAAIACPVMAVSGWTDGYSDAVLRLMERLTVPRKALIGPWTHLYPMWGVPGPPIGFLQECLRWWRHWLLGEDSGIMDEPPFRVWIGHDLWPHARDLSLDGEWASLPGWPVASGEQLLHVCGDTLGPDGDPDQAPVAIDSPQQCGLSGGEWCPLGSGPGGPEFQSDQRSDDALSVCFDTRRLAAELEVIGTPRIAFELSLAAPAATLAIRLCEVREDGTSARVTFALHRVVRPAELQAGDRFTVALPLKAVAYRFAAGRRLRLALATAYWPMAWPEPHAAGMRLWPGTLRLMLPTDPEGIDRSPVRFEPPETADPIPHRIEARGQVARVIGWDAATDAYDLTTTTRRSRLRLGELVTGGDGDEVFSIDARDPRSARASFRRNVTMERPGWAVRIASSTALFWEGDELVMEAGVSAFEDGSRLFERTWRERFRRGGWASDGG